MTIKILDIRKGVENTLSNASDCDVFHPDCYDCVENGDDE